MIDFKYTVKEEFTASIEEAEKTLEAIESNIFNALKEQGNITIEEAKHILLNDPLRKYVLDSIADLYSVRTSVQVVMNKEDYKTVTDITDQDKKSS